MAMVRLTMIVAGLLLATEAFGQAAAPANTSPFRKWDAVGGIAFRFGLDSDVVVPHGDWNTELGRYWTSHFKTSITLATNGEGVYVVTSTPRSWAQTQRMPVGAGVGGAVAYQFLDNVFAHPYVAVGVRMTAFRDVDRTYSGLSYQPTSIVTSPLRLEARPTLGAGFKSYFDNGRAFLRSELQVTVGQPSARAVVRIGAGVDF